jgi:hypothetical protein
MEKRLRRNLFATSRILLHGPDGKEITRQRWRGDKD